MTQETPSKRMRTKGPCLEEADNAEPGLHSRCFTLNTLFKEAPSGRLVPASALSIGDYVLDHEDHATRVTWSKRLAKETRNLYELHVNPLIVTDNHRIIDGDGAVKLAMELSRGSTVRVGNRVHELVKVVKKRRAERVMEVEFADDAIVEAYMPGILTKGSDPAVGVDEDQRPKVKEEQDGWTTDEEHHFSMHPGFRRALSSTAGRFGSTAAPPQHPEGFKHLGRLDSFRRSRERACIAHVASLVRLRLRRF